MIRRFTSDHVLDVQMPICDLLNMPNRSSKSKRPRDTNQLAKSIVDLSTGQAVEPDQDAGKDPAAVALGRKGGLKGGKARAASMTKEQRSEAARKAAKARWAKATEQREDGMPKDEDEVQPRGVIRTPEAK